MLLLCLQLKQQLALGVVLVLSFSIAMVLTGVIAYLSVKHIQKRWSGFGGFARRASSALMVAIALYMAVSGWIGLTHPAG